MEEQTIKSKESIANVKDDRQCDTKNLIATDDGETQRDSKRGCNDNRIPLCVPKPEFSSGKDPDKFYLDTYDNIDSDCIIADGDPRNSDVSAILLD